MYEAKAVNECNGRERERDAKEENNNKKYMNNGKKNSMQQWNKWEAAVVALVNIELFASLRVMFHIF